MSSGFASDPGRRSPDAFSTHSFGCLGDYLYWRWHRQRPGNDARSCAQCSDAASVQQRRVARGAEVSAGDILCRVSQGPGTYHVALELTVVRQNGLLGQSSRALAAALDYREINPHDSCGS